MQRISAALFILPILLFALDAQAQNTYEINGSAFATAGAPLPQHIKSSAEKLILVDPDNHVWGAYNSRGALVRWGIATAGAGTCPESDKSCRTHIGNFRIYSLGDASCSSQKYDNAPMPYCMYFSGGQALHGSDGVAFNNISHGCVRMHVDDAKWLRYHFVEGPTAANNYRGTRVAIRPYGMSVD